MPSKPVERNFLRSSEKCFTALELLNGVGPIKVADLARRLGLPRTTTVRVLRTLGARGYVARGKDKKYAVSVGVNRLSAGYKPSNTIIPRIERVLEDNARGFLWPMTFVLPKADAMYSSVTTDELTPYKMFANPPGTRIPYYGTACGTVYLAYCSDEERAVIAKLASDDPASVDVSPREVQAAVKLARKRGYYFMNRWKVGSLKDRELYSHDAAIALPLMSNSRIFGVLASRFINAAVTTTDLELVILPHLKHVAGLIQDAWHAFLDDRPLRSAVS